MGEGRGRVWHKDGVGRMRISRAGERDGINRDLYGVGDSPRAISGIKTSVRNEVGGER